MDKRIQVLFLGDLALAIFSVYSIITAGFGGIFGSQAAAMDWKQAILFVFIILFTSYLAELYSVENNLNARAVLIRIMAVFLLSVVSSRCINYFAPAVLPNAKMNALLLLLFGALQFSWHLVFNALLKMPKFARRVLVVGTGRLANQIGDIISSDENSQHVLRGYYQCEHGPVEVPEGSIVKNGKGLSAAVQAEKAQKIVISVTDRRGTLPVSDILKCKFSGIEVVDAPSFYEQMTGKLLIENLRPSWFIFSEGFRITSELKMLKRVLDILFAAAGLAVTATLIPLIAIAIKLDSKGPVLFKQARVGEKERQFVIYKFRTMHIDAESGTGAIWAKKDDPRITRLGRFLRKTRLDEILQLFNVLKGDMSFVGPRPERPEFVNELKKAIPFYSERHMVKPGLTGWAQVRFPYGASIEDALEKLRYDLYYIKNISPFMDCYIVCETFKVILFKRGAR